MKTQDTASKLANTDTLTALVEDLQHSLASLTARAARIETRLSKLMLHLGMTTDGRNNFTSETTP